MGEGAPRILVQRGNGTSGGGGQRRAIGRGGRFVEGRMEAVNALKTWRTIGTAVVALMVGAGLAYAKLPPLSDEAKAKANEAKAKAADAAKAAREAEEKAMDRIAVRYKKEKGMKTVAVSKAAPKK